jgi:hypothetical protein
MTGKANNQQENEGKISSMQNEAVIQQLTLISAKQEATDAKIEKVYFALVGNELARDGGLVKRIFDMEDEHLRFQLQIRALEEKISKQEAAFLQETAKLEKRLDKSEVKARLLYTAIGLIAAGIIKFLIESVFKIKT